jgi:hypothetical protein
MADPLPPNPFPFLTPSYAGGRNSICRADTPYPSVSQESVPSQIDNLTNALYGAITKTVQNGRVIWNIPCDPTTSPSTILGVARNTNEGLLCYITRALNTAVPNAFVTIDGIQTLTNKTLTAPIINSPTINNLTATGTLSLPSGSITTAMIANGSILDIDISATAAIANGKLAGNPVSTNTASTIVLRDASGNFSTGTITGSLSGNATTAGTATNLAGTTANQIPYQSASATTSYVSAGTTGQLLVQGASSPAWGIDHIGTSTLTSTPPIAAASGYVGELLTWTSSATAITTGQTINLLSLSSGSTPSLTSGDWKFFGTIVFSSTSVTIANAQTFTGGIGTTSATTSAGKRTSIIAPTYTTTSFTIEIPLALVPIYQPASAQTVYAVATAPAFSAGSMTATAYIYARRMR